MKRAVTAFAAGLLASGLAAGVGLTGIAAAGAAPAPAPAITTVAPNWGELAGGETVTITGSSTSWSGSPIVKFDGITASGVTCSTATSCTAITPADMTPSGPKVTVQVAGQSKPLAFTYDYPTVTAVTKAMPLGAKMVAITAKGYNVGGFLLASLCNEDANLTNPSTDSGAHACSAVPVGSPTSTTSSTYSTAYTLYPGQQGIDPNSVCPQNAAQAVNGVTCILAVPDVYTNEAGAVPVWFQPPAMTATDAYQAGDATGCTVTGAGPTLTYSPAGCDTTQYHVNVIVNNAHQTSQAPPSRTAGGVPNNGGFATLGLVCSSGSGPTCVPVTAGTPPAPIPCQAWSGSTPSGPWTPSPFVLCTPGSSYGAPLQVSITAYAPPSSELGDTLPVGIVANAPVDCGPSGCSMSANDSGNPGGISHVVLGNYTVAGPPPSGASAIDFGPGKYTFKVSDPISGQFTTAAITLPVGPTS
jgi:hypothetical protein